MSGRTPLRRTKTASTKASRNSQHFLQHPAAEEVEVNSVLTPPSISIDVPSITSGEETNLPPVVLRSGQVDSDNVNSSISEVHSESEPMELSANTDEGIEEEEEIIAVPVLKKPRRELISNGKSVLISEPNIMLKSIEYKSVIKFRDEWCMITPEVRKCMDRAQHISPELHPLLRNILNENWAEMEEKEFFTAFLQWIPRSNEPNQAGQTAEERLLALRLNFTGMSLEPAAKFMAQFHQEFTIWKAERSEISDQERTKRISKLIASIIDNIKKRSTEKSVAHELATTLELYGTFKTPDEFGKVFMAKVKEAILFVGHALKFGMAFSSEANKTNNKDGKGFNRSSNGNSNTFGKPKHDSVRNKPGKHSQSLGKPTSTDEICSGCGRRNHSFKDCNLSEHPDFNKDSNIPWYESTPGKAWATFKTKEGKPFSVLPRNLTLDKMKPSNNSYSNKNSQSYGKKNNGNSKSKKLSLLALTSHVNLNKYFPFPYVRGEITHVNNEELNVPVIAKILLDTGALHSNYISSAFIQELQEVVHADISVKPAEKLTISADESIIDCKGSIHCNLKLRNYSNAEIHLPSLTLHVIPMMYDIIIGLQIIRKHDLITKHFPNLFSSSTTLNVRSPTSLSESSYVSSTSSLGLGDSSQDDDSSSENHGDNASLSDQQNASNSSRFDEKYNNFSSTGLITASHASNHKSATLSAGNSSENETLVYPPSRDLLFMIREKEELLGMGKALSGEESIEYEEDIIKQMFFEQKNNEEQLIDLITFASSSIELNSKLKTLCLKYISVFRKDLNPEPAIIPPFDIQVSKDIWERNENRLPPRKQGTLKEKEILKQITEMLKHGVIRLSQAAEFSQVLLAPKPGGEWRFCIDYRRLNDATKQIGWPLPNIKAMLHRLGEKKSKFFAKMDLTKGYFQAPLAEASRRYTAFITFCGIYEWLRVPMGLKGAPAYFQFMIATVVLVGLLYFCCELYIDDVIVFGKDEEEFLNNLERVLSRLQEKNISLNPKKCILGASAIEFVGHVIDESGLTMSPEKVYKVINFKQPSIAKGLKSFLGLANYFRDHIQNHSKIVQPLQQMIKNYKKNHKLVWTEETTKAFQDIKNSINSCPKIFFVRDDAPIFLHTDASKYAVGAYLFQLIDKKEYPIAFLSKTLTNSQLNWSTFEKEAYAIFYAFQELEYLLHDRFFTLRTDHANLTYIRDSGSEKVRRWKLYIQEYNFDIEHIKGEKNIVADALTRLVEVPEEPEHLLNLMQDNIIPPQTYRAIGKCHNSKVGHHGIQRTMDKLRAMKYSTKYLMDYVKLFVKRCPACQKMSQIKPVIETIPFTTAAYAPMHKLNMDTIGPLPETKDGYKHILVIIDCFSRWVELYKCCSTEAEEAAKHLIDFVGRYGCPKEIITDNATQFVNDTIQHFVKLFGTEHLLSIPYSKQENAIVERMNKEVMKHLRHIVFDTNISEEWADSLPFLQRIINTSKHSRTGFSPAQILFGNKINLDRNIILPFEVAEQTVAMPIYVSKMQQIQSKLVSKAVLTQMLQDQTHKAKFNKLPTEYAIGSYVLALYPNTRMGRMPPSKLHTQWKGPLMIVNNIGSKYTVRNLVSGKLEDYHVSSLKPFLMDPVSTNPESIAQKDYRTWITEAVLDHKPKRKISDIRRSQLQFLIKWEGYPSEENTWEPWKNVKHNLHVHEYLRTHKMASFVPKNARTPMMDENSSASSE